MNHQLIIGILIHIFALTCTKKKLLILFLLRKPFAPVDIFFYIKIHNKT